MNRALFVLIFLAWTASASEAGGILPVTGGTITSQVGWRRDPFGSGRLQFHRGTDIAVPTGTPVFPTAPGHVIFAGITSGYGKTVIIRHSDGRETLYGHTSAIKVAPGQEVSTSTLLALSGNSGRSTGPHLHYEVRSGATPPPSEAPAVVVAASALTRPDAEAEKKMEEIMASIRSVIYGLDQAKKAAAEMQVPDERNS